MNVRNGYFCLATILLTAGVAPAGDFSGRWRGKLSVNGDDMPGYLVLKRSGQQLTGTAGPDVQKKVKLSEGLVEGGQATIEASPGAAMLRLVLRLKSGKLSGDVFKDANKIGTATFVRDKQ